MDKDDPLGAAMWSIYQALRDRPSVGGWEAVPEVHLILRSKTGGYVVMGFADDGRLRLVDSGGHIEGMPTYFELNDPACFARLSAHLAEFGITVDFGA